MRMVAWDAATGVMPAGPIQATRASYQPADTYPKI